MHPEPPSTLSIPPELLERVRAEFAEMPGLYLTLNQAARLWAIDQRSCEAALKALVDARFLLRNATGSYRRADTA
jgi:hypothetical protein